MMGPKRVRKPDAESVSEALNLLVIMGGDNKAAKKLLEEMKAAQEHNTDLLNRTNDAINKSAHISQEVSAAQSKLAKDSKKALDEFEARDDALFQMERDLETQKSLFAAEMRDKRGALDLLKSDFASTKRDFDRDVVANNMLAKSLDARLGGIKKSEGENRKASEALADRKADMDKRDALMKAAMGG